jgi:hypothetical protein
MLQLLCWVSRPGELSQKEVESQLSAADTSNVFEMPLDVVVSNNILPNTSAAQENNGYLQFIFHWE